MKTDQIPEQGGSLRPTLGDVVKGARTGLLFAVGFVVIAALIYSTEGPRPFEANDTSFGMVVILYLVGFTAAGAIAGTFHRSAGRYPKLAYVIGIVAAAPISFAATAAVTHNVLLWRTGDWIPASILAVVYGILGVRLFRKDPIKWD